MTETVTIEKLVHGGQGLATLADGRKVFVWNALPGERVIIEIKKGKRSYAEAVATEILQASPDRIEPRDQAYLSTSPWQIVRYETENQYKQQILAETYQREHVVYDKPIAFHAGEHEWHYRNKMEYSFWGDDDGLHLALFNRGSHGKQIVTGSSIARPEIDATANEICRRVQAASLRAGQLKTVIVRCNQQGETVAALFVKDEAFPKSTLDGICRGVAVNFSNPKSPASVLTRELYRFGDITLSDQIMGCQISYDVNSFFQVNVPVFEWAAKRIDYFVGGAKEIVDMYAGVGTIGIPINATKLIELDAHNVAMARQNIGERPNKEVIGASAETALDYIPPGGALVVDPPRAGLHTKVVERILDAKPATVAYLSCNPITQARDLALLQQAYEITALEGYNFFPRTPHIEALAILILKS